jgi:hypothetical protein
MSWVWQSRTCTDWALCMSVTLRKSQSPISLHVHLAGRTILTWWGRPFEDSVSNWIRRLIANGAMVTPGSYQTTSQRLASHLTKDILVCQNRYRVTRWTLCAHAWFLLRITTIIVSLTIEERTLPKPEIRISIIGNSLFSLSATDM